MHHILFVIYTFQGTGGHYYSLCATAQALSSRFHVHILNIGEKESPVISNSSLPHSFLPFSGRNFMSVMKGIGRVCREQKADIIHCFDIPSYLVSVFPSWRLRLPIVLTKCGGPILSKNQYPVAENFIFYNLREYQLFLNDAKYKNKNLQLIPNRVGQFDSDYDRISDLQREFGLQDRKVIVRIGRIAEAYQRTALQCIRLVKDLHAINPSYYLLLIGNIKDQSVYNCLKAESDGCDYISILTEDRFTFNAKELIDLADVVVGTGRGFMEACQKGKKMMAPCKNTRYPVVVTADNFDEILANNISERYVRQEAEDSIERICELLNNAPDSRIWYDSYFSIDTAIDRYEHFYMALKPASPHFLSVIIPVFRLYLSSFPFLRKIKSR